MTKPQKVSTMMDRRQFVYAGAAGLALSAQIPKAYAATYDLLIKGGRVIDPSAGLDAVRDVAIAGGKIVAVAENIRVTPPRRSMRMARSSPRV
jgi:dihydroorotase